MRRMFKRQRVLLLFSFFSVMFVLSVYPAPWVSAEYSLTTEEKLTLRRESIELDVHLRNLQSALALGSSTSAYRTLVAMSGYSTKKNPHFKENLATAIEKLKEKNVEIYFRKIHNTARQAAAELKQTMNRGVAVKWQNIENHTREIIQNCRSCHFAMLRYKK